MANGTNGNRMIYTLVGGLALAMILGGISLAGDQRVTEIEIANMKAEQARQRVAIEQIPVIQNDIEHIKGALDDLKAQNADVLKAIEAIEK